MSILPLAVLACSAPDISTNGTSDDALSVRFDQLCPFAPPTISPDGQHVLFRSCTHNGADSLMVLDVASGATKVVSTGQLSFISGRGDFAVATGGFAYGIVAPSTTSRLEIHVRDWALTTDRTLTLSSSAALDGPDTMALTPDGKYVALVAAELTAVSPRPRHFYAVATQVSTAVSELTPLVASNSLWTAAASPDSKSFLLQERDTKSLRVVKVTPLPTAGLAVPTAADVVADSYDGSTALSPSLEVIDVATGTPTPSMTHGDVVDIVEYRGSKVTFVEHVPAAPMVPGSVDRWNLIVGDRAGVAPPKTLASRRSLIRASGDPTALTTDAQKNAYAFTRSGVDYYAFNSGASLSVVAKDGSTLNESPTNAVVADFGGGHWLLVDALGKVSVVDAKSFVTTFATPWTASPVALSGSGSLFGLQAEYIPPTRTRHVLFNVTGASPALWTRELNFPATEHPVTDLLDAGQFLHIPKSSKLLLVYDGIREIREPFAFANLVLVSP